MKKLNFLLAWSFFVFFLYPDSYAQVTNFKDSLCFRKVVLDDQGMILPWFVPQDKAYDQFLRIRWDFIKTKVPNCPGPPPRSNYPQYYFYCEYVKKNGVIETTKWMNDVGEKIPNWFENARLYYAYTGDESVMNIVKGLVDYAMKSGARVVLRGIRAVTDYDYEFQMALMNRRMQPAIETAFMVPAQEYSYLSSSLVKEIYALGGSVKGLVPSLVETALAEKIVARSG